MATEVDTGDGLNRRIKHPGKRMDLYRSVRQLTEKGYWSRILALFKEQRPESRKREQYQISAILIAHSFQRALTERGGAPLEGLYVAIGDNTFQKAQTEDLVSTMFSLRERLRNVMATTMNRAVYNELTQGGLKDRILYWRLKSLMKKDSQTEARADSAYQFIKNGAGTAVKTIEQLIGVTEELLQEHLGNGQKPSIPDIALVVKNSHRFILEIASGHKDVSLTMLGALTKLMFSKRWSSFDPKNFQLVDDGGRMRVEIRPEVWNALCTKSGELIIGQTLQEDWLGCPALVGTKAIFGKIGGFGKYTYKNVVEGLFDWFLDVYEKFGVTMEITPE